MQYKQLSDWKVSVICLGTMTWGKQNTEAEAHDQLDLAIERDINFIDTAEMYPVPPEADTYSLTEQYIGSWLKKKPNIREKIILATKAAGPNRDMNWMRTDLTGGPRLNRAHLVRAVDDSLKRLNTDYIDLYQMHWPERLTNYFGKLDYNHNEEHDKQTVKIEETLTVLAELIEQGKIRKIGISNETPWGVMEYLRCHLQKGLPRIISVQNPYNLLNRTYEVGLSEMSIRENIGLLAYSPLAFGVLSGKYLDGSANKNSRLHLFSRFDRYTNPQAESATKLYIETARKHGVDPSVMALAFVNSRQFVSSNIIGATTIKQLELNISSADYTISDELEADLNKIHVLQPNPAP